MPHMIPHYEHTRKWLLEQPNGESHLFDDIYDATNNIHEDKEIGDGEQYTITCQHGWFARLSADGYMDCTDWGGPFSSEEIARDYIADNYEVDPDTGEPLEDDAHLWQPDPEQIQATEENKP